MRPRRRADRHRLRIHLEQRAPRLAEAQDTAAVGGYELGSTALPSSRVRISRGGGAFHRDARRPHLGAMTPVRSAPSPRAGMSTTEAALMTRGFSQLYVSLGDINADGLDRRAHLSQAAGAVDLVRAVADSVRRVLSLTEPPPARRRAEAGQGAQEGRRPAGGGVGPVRALPAYRHCRPSCCSARMSPMAVLPTR